MTTGRTLRLGEAVFGGGLIALGLFIIIETMLAPGTNRGAVGPALFPYLIAAGLLLVGLFVLREAVVGTLVRAVGTGTEALELDGPAIALACAGLVAQFLLIEQLGWVPSAALLFMAVARAFGSRRLLLDALLGLALAAGTFIAFNYALDLDLPAGSVLEAIMPAEDAGQ